MDDTIPQVEGLRLVERVDDAGRGEVWRARITGGLAGKAGVPLPGDLAGVGECRVRLLRMPVDEAFRARAQMLARDLQALDEPGLVPIRAVLRAYDGVALVYGHLPAAAMGLHLLARRRLLRAGEVVTLGVGLCWALAAAHEAGIVHGRLADADVRIGADGRPVLTGVGVLGVMGAPGEPQDDVRALGRMLGSLLDRESAGAAPVVRALAGGAEGAAELAVTLAAAAAAAPIGVDEAAPPAAEIRRRRKMSGRGLPRSRRPSWLRPRVLLAAGGVVVLGAMAGWMSAPGPAARHVAGRGPAPASEPAPDWQQELSRLDAAWALALERPDIGFAAVDVPSGPAERSDTATAAALRANGVHAAGLRLVLLDVAVETAAKGRVTLRVTDQRPAYELRDAAGEVVRRVAGRGPAAHHVELQAGASGWRIARVTEVS